jgi:NAD(P)H-flavin reductase
MTAMAAPMAPTSPWLSHLAHIKSVKREVPGISTYEIAFDDPQVVRKYRFRPGQFNMLYLPGFGESAISISSNPAHPEVLLHTIRVAGNVTRALARKRPGDQIGVRGPFGTAWPVEACQRHDLVLACGGVGLAPLRPVIYHIMNHREDYGRVILLYGARTPQDLLYADEYALWRDANVEVEVTVDIGEEDWHGHIGVVPVLFYRLRLKPERTAIMTCGPEIMMRFVIFEALARKVSRKKIFISMERNMQCGLGICGHCQLGPTFVCKDGPVFPYHQMEPYLHLEDF